LEQHAKFADFKKAIGNGQCAVRYFSRGENRMPSIDSFLVTWSPRVLSILRIIVGLLFLEHGTSKYLSLPISPMTGVNPMSLSGINGILELVGGVLIVLGLFTRPVAFILSGDMAVAYFMAHAPKGFFPLLNGGELAIIYCFVFLYFATAGGGVWSIDHLRTGSEALRPRSA
jgi:putative oxidoreductase